MLKDTEKIGLYIQLIREALSVLLDVFRVEANPEFTEFLHLCLIAFESVSRINDYVCPLTNFPLQLSLNLLSLLLSGL